MAKKALLVTLAVLVVGSGTWAALQWYRTVAVQTETATERTVTRLVSGTGYFIPVSERTVVTRHAMALDAVNVESGDSVQEGDVLAEGDYSDLQIERVTVEAELGALRESLAQHERNLPLQVAAARSALEVAREDLQQAGDDAERLRELFEAGAAAEDDYRRAKIRAAAAEAEVGAAEARLDQLQGAIKGLSGDRARADALAQTISHLDRKIAEYRITAPEDMVVSEVFVERGDVVSPGTPLFLLQSEEMQLRIEVLAGDAPEVAVGQRVLVTGDAVGDEEMTGSVRFIHPRAVETVSELGVRQRRVPVRIDLDEEAPGARPGYPADIEIVVAERTALAVSRDVLFTLEGADHVFLVRDGRAHVTRVSVGLRGEDYAEITDGLAEGDVVVVNPPRDLEDGARVRETN